MKLNNFIFYDQVKSMNLDNFKDFYNFNILLGSHIGILTFYFKFKSFLNKK